MQMKILSIIAALALPLAAHATEYQTVDHPRQECWNEQVAGQSGLGGAIIGGIAGGLLGNQVGGGNGKTVATAVGAMTGAVVGDRLSTDGPSYQTVRRCRTVVDQERVPVDSEPGPVYESAPAYDETIPVYEPAPAYDEPAPTYYEQTPVLEQRSYYIERQEPGHREHWNHEREDREDQDVPRHDRGEHGDHENHDD